MGSSSFDDYSLAREMCMEIGGGGRGRRSGSGGSRTAADGGKTTKQKQPQRGLGVAQLEKIRLHNQMLAAYRSAAAQQLHDHHHHPPRGHDVDAAASTTMMHHQLVPPPRTGGGSSFQPYNHLTNRCFEETDHHRGVVHYYDGLLPYSSTPTSPPAPTPPLYAHDVRDSSGHSRLGQQPPPPQQHYWMMSSRSDGATSAEELDLELRL